jgi:CrcB protein
MLAAVAVGGALGATARWAVGESWERHPGGWPWATLIVNLVGCVAIGIAARRLIRDTVPWAFAVTGFLGGFTTFSAFAVEVNDLLDADRASLAALYLTVTLLGGYVATAIAEGRRDR